MSDKEYPIYTSEQLHIFDGLPSGMMILALNEQEKLEYVYSNTVLAANLGYAPEELQTLLRENVFALIYEADKEKTQSAREAVMRDEIVQSISRQKKKDGSFVWILAHIRKVIIDGRIGLLFHFSGIQELIGLQNDSIQRKDEWHDVIESIPMGVWVFREDNGIRTTLSVNSNLVNVANVAGSELDNKHRHWTEAEIAMLLNQDLYAFCENDDIPLVKKMLEESETSQVASSIFRLRGSSMGNCVFLYSTVTSKKNEDGSRTCYVTFQNVTKEENYRRELFANQAKLYELSYYDALTGVKNRNAYNEFVTLCRKNRINNVGFAFCDLNGLKRINDSLGHLYGDQMIIRFTTILKEYFNVDNIFRISGDEFVVILPFVERMDFQKKMGELIDRAKSEENIASIGFVWKKEVSDIPRRTQQAEQLMYVEKQRYYEASRNISSKHRPQILESLLRGFEQGQFLMYLQPKTSIDGSRIIGAEALARKLDRNGNIIPPYEFVPQLEHEKLIPKLDFYIMEQACKFLQEQHKTGNDDIAVSVNISRVTIVENEFLSTVTDILDKYDFVRSNLEFELTESNKTMDSIRLEEYLGQIKELGLKISIDDMGTEYSTLNLLTLDGINWVKLDRSLVSHLGQGKDKTLLKHIINMCHDLNMNVIAEGVETEDVRIELMDMGCDAYQGYLTSKPISVKEFEEKFL